MDRGGSTAERTHAMEGLVQQLIDEETLGVCFELHRAIKLSYYDLLYPDKCSIESHEVVDQPGCDVFGNTIHMLRKPVECTCPSCNRTLGASKFAPHLEKCLGMGRARSRLVHKRTVAVESEGEGSEDNEEEWIYPEKKSRKLKKEKISTISPRKLITGKPSKREKAGESSYSTNGGGSSESFYQLKPSLQQHNAASFSALPAEYQHNLLQQICAVVSERTGRLCTRSVNCPQHTEEQRAEVRRRLLEHHPLELINLSPSSSSSSSSSHKFFRDSSASKYTTEEETPVKSQYDHHSYDDLLKPPKKKLKEGGGGGGGGRKHKKHSTHHTVY